MVSTSNVEQLQKVVTVTHPGCMRLFERRVTFWLHKVVRMYVSCGSADALFGYLTRGSTRYGVSYALTIQIGLPSCLPTECLNGLLHGAGPYVYHLPVHTLLLPAPPSLQAGSLYKAPLIPSIPAR